MGDESAAATMEMLEATSHFGPLPNLEARLVEEDTAIMLSL